MQLSPTAWAVIGGACLLAFGGAAAVVSRRRTSPNADGIILDDPAQLARESGEARDVYALARMIASEHPRDGENVQTAIAWATRNYAARARISVWDLLVTRGRADTRDAAGNVLRVGSANHFARQNAGGKYASTVNDPTDAHIAVARKVMTGAVADPTGGATQYDSPQAQRAAAARDVDGYTKTPEQVAADRSKTSDLVVLAGVSPDYLRFWRPREVA